MREAVADDREAVISIRDNVYGGSDYLPTYYQHFMASCDITSFVLLHQDKIVSRFLFFLMIFNMLVALAQNLHVFSNCTLIDTD